MAIMGYVEAFLTDLFSMKYDVVLQLDVFFFCLLHDMWLCICLQIASNYDMQMCQHMVMGLVISVSSVLWPLAPYLRRHCKCHCFRSQLVCSC